MTLICCSIQPETLATSAETTYVTALLTTNLTYLERVELLFLCILDQQKNFTTDELISINKTELAVDQNVITMKHILLTCTCKQMIQTCMHAHPHTHTLTRTHTRTHAHTHTHARTHTHIHKSFLL